MSLSSGVGSALNYSESSLSIKHTATRGPSVAHIVQPNEQFERPNKMNKVTITVAIIDLQKGDEIINTLPMEGLCEVRRMMPDICHDINATLQYALENYEEITAAGLIAIDEHLRAGGDLPDTWCSGVDETGPWIRQGGVIRPSEPLQDMPGEDDLEAALLEAARYQMPHRFELNADENRGRCVCGKAEHSSVHAHHVWS